MGLLKSVISGFISGGIIVVLTEMYVFITVGVPVPQVLPIFIVNLIIYGVLGYCYFHFINLGETARRIRILRELYDANGGLTLEEILQRYNAGNIVEMRINRLLKNDQIKYNNGRYYIGKPIMLLIAKIILLMKRLILGKKSEFDR